MLTLTCSALQKLAKKILSQDLSYNSNTVFDISTSNYKPCTRFRIKVTGGGCSGYQYRFLIDEEQYDENDIVLSAPQIHYELIVDKHSLPLIQGSVLDYHISLAGEYFVLQNPNAKMKCGCGNSFST